MRIEVTVRIQAASEDDERPCHWIADKVVRLGGRLIAWQPETASRPALATFVFVSAADRDKFVRAVGRMPRVSL